MKRIIAERRASGSNEKERDLLSNLIRANDDDEAGGLSLREVTGSKPLYCSLMSNKALFSICGCRSLRLLDCRTRGIHP